MKSKSKLELMKSRGVHRSIMFRRWKRSKRLKITACRTMQITEVRIHLQKPWQIQMSFTSRKIMRTIINQLRMHMTPFSLLKMVLQVWMQVIFKPILLSGMRGKTL